MLNPYPHNGVCVCVCVSAQGRGVRICMCICVCCEQSLSSLLSFAGHTAPPVHKTGHPVSTDPYRPGISRPVKSRSYRHSGRTDSIHRCCYECYQRSQFTEDNVQPSFLSGINSLCQFTVPPRTILRSPVPTTSVWARLTIMASQLASHSLV